tara:strand:- start:117 stop:458 length:342 start_codon:yes stop_codon:yes gene_type:complete
VFEKQLISSLNSTCLFWEEAVIRIMVPDEVHVMIKSTELSRAHQTKGIRMTNSEALCGTCSHFGKDLGPDLLIQIRINPHDEGEHVASCDLPDNASKHLKVSPISQCDSYQAA